MNSSRNWIALERVPGIGPAHMKEIYGVISKVGISLSDIFELTESEIKNEFTFNEKTVSLIKKAEELLPSVTDEYQKIIDSGITVTLFFFQFIS